MNCEPRKNTFATLPAADSVYLAPSLLAADFSRLAEQIRDAENAGITILHVDVMDGHFVPNLSMGPGLVKSIRQCTAMLFDVHLMLSQPGKYIDAFAAAGADSITIHVESEGNISAIIDSIHACGCSAGITLRPGTPVESLYPFLGKVELALVMTVEPGFGGQSFMASQLPKLTALKSWAAAHPARNLHIEVDGGIKSANISAVTGAGANVLVAGSSIFNAAHSVSDCVKALKDAL